MFAHVLGFCIILRIFKRSSHYTPNIVCDRFIKIRKAFDAVNHKILLDKLEHYVVRGRPFQLLRLYL